jgi:hypothetical protein
MVSRRLDGTRPEEDREMKRYLMGPAVLAALLAASASQSQEPEISVKGWRHSSATLIAAPSLTNDAIGR